MTCGSLLNIIDNMLKPSLNFSRLFFYMECLAECDHLILFFLFLNIYKQVGKIKYRKKINEH